MDTNDKSMFIHIFHGRNEIFPLELSTIWLYSSHCYFPGFIPFGKVLLGACRAPSEPLQGLGRKGKQHQESCWRDEFLQQRAAAKK